MKPADIIVEPTLFGHLADVNLTLWRSEERNSSEWVTLSNLTNHSMQDFEAQALIPFLSALTSQYSQLLRA